MRNHYLPWWYQFRFQSGIIGQNQSLSACDFKTESLIHRGNIYAKSLLTLVVSIPVSVRNHSAESMIINLRFQN